MGENYDSEGKGMNRRDFIKMLAAVPALAWLKPEVPKVENYSPSLAYIEAYKRGFEGFAQVVTY